MTFPAAVLWRFRVSAFAVQAALWTTVAIAFGLLAQRKFDEDLATEAEPVPSSVEVGSPPSLVRYRSTHMATRTRAFGAGNRESHDATPFYERFAAPVLSADDTVNPCGAADPLLCGDSRAMDAVDDCSVALMVTSPPYFAGKEYEAALGEGHIPSSYVEYLEMLRRRVRGVPPGPRVRAAAWRSTSPTSGASPTGRSRPT